MFLKDAWEPKVREQKKRAREDDVFTTDIVVAVGWSQTLFEGYNKFTKQTVRIDDFMIFKKREIIETMLLDEGDGHWKFIQTLTRKQLKAIYEDITTNSTNFWNDTWCFLHS